MAKKDFMNLMKEKTVDVRPSMLSAEENIKSQIVVLESLRNLIPPLTDSELDQLEQNIVRYGVKDPLTIWETTALTAGLSDSDNPTFILIDGHNRHQIIQKHKLDFRINLVRFTTLDDVKEYMVDYQLGRRNLTMEQASYLRGLKYLQQKSARGTNLKADATQVNVAEKLAVEHGVSSRTIRRDGDFAAGLEKMAPDLKRDVLTGKRKIPKSALVDTKKVITLDTASSSDDKVEVSSVKKSGQTVAKLTKLKLDIRELANSDLTLRQCKQLQTKLLDLITLQT